MAEYETGQIKKSQAALEAVKVLQNAGFGVHDLEIDPDAEDATFDLDLTLSILKNERPLDN